MDEGVNVDTARLQEHIDALSDRRTRLQALVRANRWDWSSGVCGGS